MKQTKKLTVRQSKYLQEHHHLDTTGLRLVEETNAYIKVQTISGDVIKFEKG